MSSLSITAARLTSLFAGLGFMLLLAGTATAESVQHVKVCSLHGAGFYYMPGSDTCMKIGGWVPADGGGIICNGRYFTSGNTCNRRGPNVVDVRECTAYGTLRGYVPVNLSCPVVMTNSLSGGPIVSSFSFFLSSAYNSYNFNFRVRGGTSEKINTGDESFTIGGEYHSQWGLNFYGTASGTPIFNSGDWKETIRRMPLDSGSVTGSSVASATGAAGYPLHLFNNWLTAEPYVAIRYTTSSLSGTSDGFDVNLLQSHWAEFDIGAAISRYWTAQISSTLSGYYGWNRAVVGNYDGNGSNWGINGAESANVPSAPDWRISLYGGYASLCAPLSFAGSNAQFSYSDLHGGVAFVYSTDRATNPPPFVAYQQ